MSTETDSVSIQNALRRVLAMDAWRDERLYAQVSDVSQWSPAQHLVHLCESTRLILDHIEALEQGTDPEAARTRAAPRLAGRAVLLAGRIPRGRAEAPPGTVPVAVPARAALRDSVHTMARRVGEAAGRAHGFRTAQGARLHPALGWLHARQWWRFLRVHLDHHLGIVDDIDRHQIIGDPLQAPARPVSEHP